MDEGIPILDARGDGKCAIRRLELLGKYKEMCGWKENREFQNIWKAAVSGILFAVSVALVFCDQTAKADEEYVSWKLESGESIDAAKDDYVITHTDQMSEEDASLYKKNTC